MKKFALCLAMLLLYSSAALAGGFNCANPPFGASLDEINKSNEFVKYKTANNIVYYNYVGDCKIEQQKNADAKVAYGFVDNKLYARIISIKNNAKAKAELDFITENISKQLGVKPDATYDEGNWKIISWSIPEKQMKYKFKYNMKNKTSKSAYYYTPLNPNQAEDKLLSSKR